MRAIAVALVMAGAALRVAAAGLVVIVVIAVVAVIDVIDVIDVVTVVAVVAVIRVGVRLGDIAIAVLVVELPLDACIGVVELGLDLAMGLHHDCAVVVFFPVAMVAVPPALLAAIVLAGVCTAARTDESIELVEPGSLR